VVVVAGGLPDGMYDSLPRQVRSRGGYVGCVASLELGGDYVNPLTDALVPSNLLLAGCEGLYNVSVNVITSTSKSVVKVNVYIDLLQTRVPDARQTVVVTVERVLSSGVG